MNFDPSQILDWLAINPNDLNTLWQVLAAFIIILVTWFSSRYVTHNLHTRIASQTEQNFKRLSYNAIQRLYAPLFASLFFSIAVALFKNFNLAHKILSIALPLAISLGAIRFSIYILRKVFPKTPFLKAWENVFVVAVWSTFALHILGWLPDAIEIVDNIAINFGDSKVSLLSVLKIIASVIVFVLLALWFSNAVERKLARTQYIANYLRIGIAKTVRVVSLILAFLVALDVIGFDLTTLTVLGGALGVGIGFGLQRIASNFISGFILLFDRSIRPDDVISIGDSYGWVKELRARYVVIQDRNGVERLIPNENLVTTEVINWSYTDKNIRLKIPVQISYGDDPEQAMALMLEAARETGRVLATPEPAVRLLCFGDNGIKLELRIWIEDPINGVNSVRSDVNLSIWKKFKEHNVTIPFPQRDVHIFTGQEVKE